MPALLFLLGAGTVYAAAWWWAAATLPDRVPLHFGGSLAADRFGSRTEALWSFGLLGLCMLGLFAGLWLLVRRGSLRLVNVPHKRRWVGTEHEPELRRRLQVDVGLLGGATLLLLTAVEILTVQAARSTPVQLSPSAWVVLGGYLVVVLGWAGWVGTHRYRPPER